MKLYIVTVDWAYDNDEGVDVIIFTEKEDARAKFNSEMHDAIQAFENCGGYVMDGDDTEFTIFENGFYTDTHFVVRYEETELDKSARIQLGGSI